MYPHDNIFKIYYTIGKRTPFLVKRCEPGLVRSSTEERRTDPKKDRTFLVEKVYPKGKYGYAYGKCFVDGIPLEGYTENDIIPCAGCGGWVLIDVPGVQFNKLFPIRKAIDIMNYGKYKGKTIGEIFEKDSQYLYRLESSDRFFRIDHEELYQLYPNIATKSQSFILEKMIDFGKYKGKKYKEIKDDIAYLEWMVSVKRLTKVDLNLIIS